MKTQEAIKYAGSSTQLASLLGVSVSAISQWGEQVPQARVWQLQLLKPDWFRTTKIVRVKPTNKV